MLVSDIRLVSSEGQCELQALVKSNAARKSFLLRYRFPSAFEEFVSTENGNPFLPALLLPAMKLHEPLEIPVPVSSRLLRSVHEIQRIFERWDPTLSEVQIKAPIREKQYSEVPAASNRGIFFSCGVDSFYSLLRNVQNHPADEEAITHLIVVHGFDTWFAKRSELFEAIAGNTSRIARELGKKVIPAATNLKDFGDRFVPWDSHYHGAFLASMGLALENLFEKIYIASSHNCDQLFPWGSHPILDPLWSTERLSFVHDGSETRRIDKTRYISQFPIVLQTLRVCNVRSYTRNVYNCGSCEKCLRTMIGLHVAGALQKCTTLPHFIDVRLVRNIAVSTPNTRTFTEELVNSLGSSEADLAMRSALEEGLSGDTGPMVRRRLFTIMTHLMVMYLPPLLPIWTRVQQALTRQSAGTAARKPREPHEPQLQSSPNRRGVSERI